jgi:hypothetical protein
MELNDIKILPIHKIKDENKAIGRILRFNIQKACFYMFVCEVNGLYTPQSILHYELNTENNKCPFCDKGIHLLNSNRCNILSQYNVEIFHRLIESKEIRMDWLYVPHV